VGLPDLTRVDAPVQAQLREREQVLKETMAKPAATDEEKAAAFGGVAVLLHAAEFYEAAEPAYLNAQDLAPREAKWPYLLSHLHRSIGETAKAIAELTRVLEIAPNDVAALIWLGRMYLDQGQAERAEPLFERANTAAPQTAAALLGLGQAALGRKDYARAVSVLEEALRASPSDASLHSPLAMAYRGLGDTAKAEAHLREWRNTEVVVPDPVRAELDLALQSGLSFEQRGIRALEARDFQAAADFFRQGVVITRGETLLGRSLHHKLGTALYLQGDLRGAVEQFRETVRLAPKTGRDEMAARAHYSLGVLMASAGLGAGATEHLTAAVGYNPSYLEAVVALADALRRSGRVEDSLPHYRNALQINPRATQARLGYGIALVRVGRYREARAWFEESVAAQPDSIEFKHALARVLVSSPDDGARDGARGLKLVQDVMASTTERPTALGETLAMALAETGDTSRATGIQRDLIAVATKAGLAGDVRRMTRNLRVYEQRRACREPWAADDSIHAPGPPIDLSLRPLFQ
jgi:tetratricopeptide (TPR) repeat protein